VKVDYIDPAQAAITRRRALDELAGAGIRVFTCHLRSSGRVERAGKGFRWAVE
jgi:hypothetical protein